MSTLRVKLGNGRDGCSRARFGLDDERATDCSHTLLHRRQADASRRLLSIEARAKIADVHHNCAILCSNFELCPRCAAVLDHIVQRLLSDAKKAQGEAGRKILGNISGNEVDVHVAVLLQSLNNSS